MTVCDYCKAEGARLRHVILVTVGGGMTRADPDASYAEVLECCDPCWAALRAGVAEALPGGRMPKAKEG